MLLRIVGSVAKSCRHHCASLAASDSLFLPRPAKASPARLSPLLAGSGASGAIRLLADHGFCTAHGKPMARVGWVNEADFSIVATYNQILRDCRELFAAAAASESEQGARRLKQIEHILHESCVKTLCHKHRSGHRKNLYQTMGRDLLVTVPQPVVARLCGQQARERWLVRFDLHSNVRGKVRAIEGRRRPLQADQTQSPRAAAAPGGARRLAERKSAKIV